MQAVPKNSSRTGTDEGRLKLPDLGISMLVHPDYSFPLFSNSNVFILPDEDDWELIDHEFPWAMQAVGHNVLEQFQCAFSVLSVCRKQWALDPNHTSYGMKHDLEDITRLYISEGAFIRAALAAQFILVPVFPDGTCVTNLLYDEFHYRMLRQMKKALSVVNNPIDNSQTDSSIQFQDQSRTE